MCRCGLTKKSTANGFRKTDKFALPSSYDCDMKVVVVRIVMIMQLHVLLNRCTPRYIGVDSRSENCNLTGGQYIGVLSPPAV